MTIELRGYQKEAIQAVLDAHARGIKRPAVVLPTGTGKSLTMAGLAMDARAKGLRVLFLAHRGELLRQLRDSVHKLDPTQEVGMVQAMTREYSPDIVVASVDTLASKVDHHTPLGRRDLILVDEAHHYAAVTYLEAIEKFCVADLQRLDEDSPEFADPLVVGFTATMFRSDGGLTKIWEEVVFERDIEWAIENGFLVPPRGRVVIDDSIDLSQVTVRGGDYAAGELEDMMMTSVDTTVQAVLDYAPGRSVIVFASGVEHCARLAERLTEYGVPAAAVVGSTSTEEREELFDAFLDQKLKALVTVQVLTEGTDLPVCDCVVMARPTKSKNLYSQAVGRALRLYPGKDDALVIDLVGSSRTLNLIGLTDLTPSAVVEGDTRTEPEEPTGGGSKPKKQRMGIVTTEEFDVIRGGAQPFRWLTSTQGIYFLTDREVATFLWRSERGKWWVGEVTVEGNLQYQWINTEPLAPVEARKLAEATATRAVRTRPGASANSLHRYKSHFTSIAPSEQAVRFAQVLGIEGAEDMTKHRLSDEIDVALVSRRFN